MTKKLRSHLTYANVIATAALFLALAGGVAYGASQLAPSSVGSKQLKKGAVTSAKVKNGSLRSSDFLAADLPKGQRGSAGERGPQGERGLPGAPGATKVVVRWGNQGKPKENESGVSFAECAEGETVVGGGFDYEEEGGPEEGEFGSALVAADRPAIEIDDEGTTRFPAPADGTDAEGWLAEVENETADTIYFHAYALCARP